jgi:hypothetical protein
MISWAASHWLDLLQSIGIVASLLFSHLSFRADVKARRVSNTFAVTAQHREIWSQLVRHPELARILEKGVDLDKNPITAAEETFVLALIHHLGATVEAIDAGILIAPEGLPSDIRSFFSLPIPREVWGRFRSIQNRQFATFINNIFRR